MVASHAVRCQSVAGAVDAHAEEGFVGRLRRETRLLLERGTLAAASEKCEQQPSRLLLSELGSAELAELFVRVEALVAAVDGLADRPSSSAPPSERELAPVREEYRRFLKALERVAHQVLGPDALPLSRTRWWVPLLKRWRYYVCSLFSWGLLPEEVVVEVAALLRDHGAVGMVDPLAGSGWHARLWRDFGGLRVVALDAYAFRPLDWTEVKVVPDSRAVPGGAIPPASQEGRGADSETWALYLSWPPHTPETVGLDLLRQWPSSLLVYLGERGDPAAGEEGVTGGRSLLEAIERDWEPLRTWSIPCWPGYSDDLTVYRRKSRV